MTNIPFTPIITSIFLFGIMVGHAYADEPSEIHDIVILEEVLQIIINTPIEDIPSEILQIYHESNMPIPLTDPWGNYDIDGWIIAQTEAIGPLTEEQEGRLLDIVEYVGPWSHETYESGEYPRLGDPLLVSFTGEACTKRIHADQIHKPSLDLFDVDHDVNLGWIPCI